METYDGVTEEVLFDNLAYFLKRIIPVCEEMNVKMAIHPDDPPWGDLRLAANHQKLV